MPKIEKYLSKKPETHGLQVDIDKALHARADKVRKKLGVTWRELVSACLERVVDEQSR